MESGLAARGETDGIWSANANRIDTTRLAGVTTLPAAEHGAGAFLFGRLHREVRRLPSLASLRRSIRADISQIPLGCSPPVVDCPRSAAWGPAAADIRHVPGDFSTIQSV